MTGRARALRALARRSGAAGLPGRALVIVAAVTAAGSGSLGLFAFYGSDDWSTLALLMAAALITEWLNVPGDEDPLDAAGAQAFSFSSGIHIAAVVLVGPFAAGFVAVFALLVADLLRRESPVKIAFNASVFALASVAAGGAFVAAGGTVGSIALPNDLVALAALWLAYTTVNTLLVSILVSTITHVPLALLLDQKLRSEFASAAGEAGVGLSFALFVQMNGWGTVFLIPLLFGVYQARARLAQLRVETARSLETFANVVDERDPSTHRHSERVAVSVRELAVALDLPTTSILTLRWAARLHDLGKISVDSSILMKPGRLADEEWTSMRRHPRLSARLLRRFRFAAPHTRAVEYHHERFDGRGYYAVPPEAIPMEAYFIAVADSFDAMVSDRPYRSGLPEETALAEIERGAGTQFHPLVARAFVALKRGLDPKDVLSPEELRSLAEPFTSQHDLDLRSIASAVRDSRLGVLVVTIAASLAALASGRAPVALAALAALAAVLAVLIVERLRTLALARRLAAQSSVGSGADRPLSLLRAALATAARPTWAALVEWDPQRLQGRVVSEVGMAGNRASEERIVSWLLRDADDGAGLLRREDDERDGAWLALRLASPAAVEQFAVFAFAHTPARRLEAALLRARADIADMLLGPGAAPVPPVGPVGPGRRAPVLESRPQEG